MAASFNTLEQALANPEEGDLINYMPNFNNGNAPQTYKFIRVGVHDSERSLALFTALLVYTHGRWCPYVS